MFHLCFILIRDFGYSSVKLLFIDLFLQYFTMLPTAVARFLIGHFFFMLLIKYLK